MQDLMKHGKPYKGYGNQWTRAFQAQREACRQDIVAYKMIWGDLVAFVDHYYYALDSKEMKYLLNTKEVRKE